MSKLALSICDWESRQHLPVGDQSARGVVPALVSQAVGKRRAHGCCSPELPPETRLGEVRFIAPHTRGNGCFNQNSELTVTPAQLKF